MNSRDTRRVKVISMIIWAESLKPQDERDLTPESIVEHARILDRWISSNSWDE